MKNKQRDQYLLKNTIIFAIGNFGTKFISFFLVPLYTYILSTHEYGIVDLVYTVGTVLVPVMTFNIGESVMRFSLDKDAEQNKIMSTGLVFLLIAILLGVVIFPSLIHYAPLAGYVQYIYLYMITYASSWIFLCYLKGKELVLHYSIAHILKALTLSVFNILFLVFMKKGIEGYLTAYILSNILTAIYAFLAGDIFQVIKNIHIDFSLSMKMVKYSVVFIPNSLMWWIMNSSDRIMVTAMIGADVNGIYAVAYKIPTLLTMLTGVFNQAWSYSAIRENESKDKEEYSNEIYNRLVSGVLLIAIGLLMIVKIFLKYYVEKSYYVAWRYTPYLVVGFVFMTLGTFASSSYSVHKDSWGFLFSGTMGAVVNVILNLILIPLCGATGAAIATGISYFTFFIYCICDTRKYLRLVVLRKKHILGYVLLLITATTIFIDNILGQIILICEFGLALMLFKEFWYPIMLAIFKRLKLFKRNSP